jgi:chromosome segregation ATPase
LGFQTAALVIAGSIALIVLAHVTNWLTTRTIRNAGLARLREANSLLLAAQLQLVKSRAVTPEEMADSLTAAGSLLQEALLEVSEVLPRFEGISTGLEKVVSGLATASQSLDATSKFIRQSTDALEDLPTRIEPLLDVLRDAPAAMQSTLDEFLTATAEATQTNQNTATAAQRLAQSTSNLAGDVSAIGRQLNDVAAKVTETMSFVASLPQSLGDHAQVAVELSRSLESATPVAIVFKEGSEQLSESVKQLAAMVSELREAANRYRDSGGDASGRY